MEIFFILILIIVIIVIVSGSVKSNHISDDDKNEQQLINIPRIDFNRDCSPGKEEILEIKEYLEKKYTPRTGRFIIEIHTLTNKELKVGDNLEAVFKTKEAYCQNYIFDIGFKYNGEYIAVEGEIYDENHPLNRLIRAHFSGYEIDLEIEGIDCSYINVAVQFKKDGQLITKKVVRNKSTKTRGKFDVVGYRYLPEDLQRMVWKELKAGDVLKLEANPTNTKDNEAIMVMFNEIHIGWVSKGYKRKAFLFKALMEGKEIDVKCASNNRGQEYWSVKKDGKWQDEYKGMTQYVEANFSTDKE